MTDEETRKFLDQYVIFLKQKGEEEKAIKIEDALKLGHYPPKYIYLLVVEGQLT